MIGRTHRALGAGLVLLHDFKVLHNRQHGEHFINVVAEFGHVFGTAAVGLQLVVTPQRADLRVSVGHPRAIHFLTVGQHRGNRRDDLGGGGARRLLVDVFARDVGNLMGDHRDQLRLVTDIVE